MSIASYKTTLISQLKSDIESKIRSYILAGDATPYPNLSNFSQALSEAIVNRIVDAITSQAKVNVTVPSVAVSAGSFTAGATPVSGSGATASQSITNGTIS